MKIRTILFPTDFSDEGNVLTLATSLACQNNARLLIAHAAEVFVPMDEMGAFPIPITDTEKVEREQLEAIVPPRPDVQFEHRLLFGSPIGSILSLAEEEDVDLIVMGTHGRTGFTRLLMGSVAEAIVRRAPCPVLTVRQLEATEQVGELINQTDRAPTIPPSQAYTRLPDQMDMFWSSTSTEVAFVRFYR